MSKDNTPEEVLAAVNAARQQGGRYTRLFSDAEHKAMEDVNLEQEFVQIKEAMFLRIEERIQREQLNAATAYLANLREQKKDLQK